MSAKYSNARDSCSPAWRRAATASTSCRTRARLPLRRAVAGHDDGLLGHGRLDGPAARRRAVDALLSGDLARAKQVSDDCAWAGQPVDQHHPVAGGVRLLQHPAREDPHRRGGLLYGGSGSAALRRDARRVRRGSARVRPPLGAALRALRRAPPVPDNTGAVEQARDATAPPAPAAPIAHASGATG